MSFTCGTFLNHLKSSNKGGSLVFRFLFNPGKETWPSELQDTSHRRLIFIRSSHHNYKIPIIIDFSSQNLVSITITY